MPQRRLPAPCRIAILCVLCFAGCADDGPFGPDSPATIVADFPLAAAMELGYPVTRIEITLESDDETRTVDLRIDDESGTAEATVKDLPPGQWRLGARVLSEGLCLVAGAHYVDLAPAKMRIEGFDFIDWGELFPEVPKRVLFIGNSHTFFNGGVDSCLAAMAEVFDPRLGIRAKRITTGGYSLTDHWNDPRRLVHDAIGSGEWDVVCLRGSGSMLTYPDRFRAAVDSFATLIHANGGQCRLVMPWCGRGYWECMPDFVSVVDSAARRSGVGICPVGLVWQEALRQRPNIPLYDWDGGHPSPSGTYLAVCTFFASLFGASPVGLDFEFDATIPGYRRGFMQDVAWDYVRQYE